MFTSSATHALQLIADAYGNSGAARDPPPALYQLASNHTSVVGLRNALQAKGWTYHVVKASELSAVPASTAPALPGCPGDSLFSMPALCSYSGTKLPLSWVQSARSGHLLKDAEGVGVRCKVGWCCLLGRSCLLMPRLQVLLDAASYVSSHALDLGKVPADFTVLSFYKLFGYPTGVGALIVRLER